MSADARETWSDERLVRGCLRGDEAAWRALVDRYSRFVWAIVRRGDVSETDQGDAFQLVWVDVYNDLEKLEKPSALRSWIGSIAHHRSYHLRTRGRRDETRRAPEEAADGVEAAVSSTSEQLAELEQQQMAREALTELTEQCRRLIELLFLEDPPRPYKEVAEELGMAVGSIGFTRGRCLEKLRRRLASRGVLGA